MFVSYLSGVDARFTVSAPAWQNPTGFEKEDFVQITEALISEPGDIQRFIQHAVDHWLRLLAVHFTRHSTRVNIDDY